MQPIKNIFNSIPWSFLLVIFGIVYYQADLLGWALLFGYIFSNLISIIHHLYWAHGYVIPKNKFIKTILDLLGYISWPSIFIHPKFFWTYTHHYHHKYWGTPDDFVQITSNIVTFIRYVIFRPLSLFLKFSSVTTENIGSIKKMIAYTEMMIQSNQDKVKSFIDRYYRILTMIIHLFLLILIGTKYYFYFIFFPIWMYSVHLALFGEYIAHAKSITKKTEKDYHWMFLFATEYSYHYSHHRYNALILGPGKWRYLNLQYYFIKLFYNIQTKTII
jgi:hypothetical protein